MLRLAVLSARGRLGAFTGALIALFAAAVLSMAWGMQLESILHTHSPVERYAGATAVVTGQQKAGVDHDVRLGGRAAVAHGWSSSVLTPYVLSAGRPPAGPDEVVTGYPATLGARLTLAA